MNTQESAQLQRALAALDAMATTWAAQIDLRASLRALLATPDAEDRLIEFVKHAHAEGLYAGRISHQTSPVRRNGRG